VKTKLASLLITVSALSFVATSVSAETALIDLPIVGIGSASVIAEMLSGDDEELQVRAASYIAGIFDTNFGTSICPTKDTTIRIVLGLSQFALINAKPGDRAAPVIKDILSQAFPCDKKSTFNPPARQVEPAPATPPKKAVGKDYT